MFPRWAQSTSPAISRDSTVKTGVRKQKKVLMGKDTAAATDPRDT